MARCALVESHSDDVLLVCSPAHAHGRATIVLIDPMTGVLHRPRHPHSTGQFATLDEAWAEIDAAYGGVRNQRDAVAPLGYLVVGDSAHLLLATAASVTASLHGDHDIWTVTETAWMNIPLNRHAPKSAMEEQHLQWMKEIVISHWFYFCETLDLTRPFPSVLAPTDASPDFVANRFLRLLFDDAGLNDLCPVLISGIAQENILSTKLGPLHLTLLTRRVCTNVGSRHFACGLDDSGWHCGNEHELELLAWRKVPQTSTAMDDHLSVAISEITNSYVVRMASMVWRQGTPPVFAHLGFPVGGVCPITPKRRDDQHRTDRYFSKLSSRFTPDTNILIVDLNRNQPGELEVTEALTAAVQHAQEHMSIGLYYVNFDWDSFFQLLGVNECVNSLLAQVEGSAFAATTRQSRRFGTCTIDLSPALGVVDTFGFHDCPSGHFATITSHTPQRGVCRLSSIESLVLQTDAAFFIALLALPAMIRSLGMSFDDLGSKTGSGSMTMVVPARGPTPVDPTSLSPVNARTTLVHQRHQIRAVSLTAAVHQYLPPRTPAPSFSYMEQMASNRSRSSVSQSHTGDRATEEPANLAVLEAAVGSDILVAFADSLNSACALMEFDYGPGLCERVCMSTPDHDSNVHMRYLANRPRVSPVILKGMQSSILSGPRTMSLRAYEETRQTAVDMFYGQRLDRILPSVHLRPLSRLPHHLSDRTRIEGSKLGPPTGGDVALSGTPVRHASFSMGSRVDSMHLTPASPSTSAAVASRTAPVRFGLQPGALIATLAPALTALTKDNSLDTLESIWYPALKPQEHRVSDVPACFLPLAWLQEGGLLKTQRACCANVSTDNNTGPPRSRLASSQPTPGNSSIVNTSKAHQTFSRKKDVSPSGKNQPKRPFVPLHARSRSDFIPVLPPTPTDVAVTDEIFNKSIEVMHPLHPDSPKSTDISEELSLPAETTRRPTIASMQSTSSRQSSTAETVSSEPDSGSVIKSKYARGTTNSFSISAGAESPLSSVSTPSLFQPFFAKRRTTAGSSADLKLRASNSTAGFSFIAALNPFASAEPEPVLEDGPVDERQLDMIPRLPPSGDGSGTSGPPAHEEVAAPQIVHKPLSIREDMSPMSRRQSVDIGNKTQSKMAIPTSPRLESVKAAKLNNQDLHQLSNSLQPLLGQKRSRVAAAAAAGTVSSGISMRLSGDATWQTLPGHTMAELMICMSELCIVSSIVLVVRFGATDLVWPRSFDLSLGRYTDCMHMKLQEQLLPVAANGTRLEFRLDDEGTPFTPAAGSLRTDLYPFNKDEGATEELCRFVKLTFYGCADAELVSLGPVEIYGFPVANTYPQAWGTSTPANSAFHMNPDVDPLLSIFDCSKSLPSLFGDDMLSDSASVAASMDTFHTSSPWAVQGSDLDVHVRLYWDLVQVQLSSERALTLVDALLLEECRMRRGIPVLVRDNLLLSHGLRLNYFDPNRFVYPRDERLLFAAANLSKTACSNRECPTHKAKGIISTWQQCHSCFNTFCEVCMSATEIRILEYCWKSPHTVCQTCFVMITKQESLLHEIRTLRAEQDRAYQSPPFMRRTLQMELISSLLAFEQLRGYQRSPPSLFSMIESTVSELVPVPSTHVILTKSVPHDDRSFPAETIFLTPDSCPRSWSWAHSFHTETTSPLSIDTSDSPGFIQSASSMISSPAMPAADNDGVVELNVLVTPPCELAGVRLVVDLRGYTEKDVPEMEVFVNDGSMGETESVGVWDLSQEMIDGRIHARDILEWRLSHPKRAHLVMFKIRAKSPHATRLHLGHLQLLQTRTDASEPTNSVSDTTTVSAELAPPQTLPLKGDGHQRTPVKVLQMKHRQGRLVCEASVDPFRMRGFSVICRHKDGRPFSQVRDVRITVGTLSVRGDLVQENQLGIFSLPLVPANTMLYFDKEVDVRGNVLTLTCLTNYGDREMCPLTHFLLYQN